MISLYQNLYKEYSAKYGANTCIFLMVGSFYELYDVVDLNGNTMTSICSAVELMNVALKEDTKGANGEIVLKAGFPEKALHKFSQVLTQKGWTVVVVDQVKDASDKVIDRIPVRILSPGTHHETATRERLSVAGLFIQDTYAMSVLDIPTGEVFSLETRSTYEILHMIQVYGVKEIIVKQDGALDEEAVRSLFGLPGLPALPGLSTVSTVPKLHISRTPLEKSYSSELFREELFQRSFQTKSLLPICATLSLPFPRNAAVEKGLCTLLQFIKEHFPLQSIPIIRHRMHLADDYLCVNNNVLEQVNYITSKGNSVLDLLEKTKSAIGARALRERMLRPITCERELEKRWGDIEWASRIRTDPAESFRKHAIDRDLKGIYDLPRIHTKISAGSPNSSEILHLFQSYTHIECLINHLYTSPFACPETLSNAIRLYREQFNESFDEEKALRRENGELVGYLSASAGSVTAGIESEIQSLLSGWRKMWEKFCASNCISADGCELQRKSDGEFQFECPRSIAKAVIRAKDSMKGLTCDLKKSGPCIVRSSFLDCTVTKIYELDRQLQTSLRSELRVTCDKLWEILDPIQDEWIKWIGYIDCTFTLATIAIDNIWVRPSISDRLSIKGMRHPLIESRNTRIAYVKHDVALKGGWLVYGVNASGKSSLMKAVGICVLLAQAGSFVPADSMCLRPYTSLYSRIWSHDNIWAGLSSFAVEIGELKDILEGANDRSLVLGDEVCSGTESVSATALVASTLETLDEKRAHFIFATHLHDLLKVPGLPRPGISVFHLRVIRTLEGKLIYDRTLLPGSGSSTYGLEVAKAMGLPFTFMERAYSIRNEILGAGSAQSSWNSEIVKETCEICKSTILNELEVHHIQHREHGGNNSARNLIVLCTLCHDKHHAGILEIPLLHETSDGPERLSTAPSTTKKDERHEKSKHEKPDRSVDEIDTIKTTLHKFKGRPPERISAALQEEGINIKIAELKRFMRKV